MCSWLTGTSVLNKQPAVARQKMARAEVSPTVSERMLILGSSQPPGDQKNCSNDIVIYIFPETHFPSVTSDPVGQVGFL